VERVNEEEEDAPSTDRTISRRAALHITQMGGDQVVEAASPAEPA